jgi:hypothetical protein
MGLLLKGMQEVGLDVFLATDFSPVLFRCKRGEYLVEMVL